MSSMYALFWFDVEDYVTPASDEALKGLLEIFEAQGTQATWKLVGEKARVLDQRERSDIIRLLQRQDIGYHTDNHSRHPVLAEYLRDMGWEDGVAEVRRQETPGYRDLVRICGPASTFGQAGGSWAPQIYPVLRELDIPLFMDEASHVGLDSGPFWYCGVLHINRLGESCVRMPLWDGDPGLDQAQRTFDALCERQRPEGGLISIYYHPCEWSTHQFWDGVNFGRGANPPRAEWLPAPVRPTAQMREGLDLFARYLAHVAASPDVEILTGRQVVNLLPDRAGGRAYTSAQISELTQFEGGVISCQRLDDVVLAPSELLALVTGCLADVARGHAHPPNVPVQRLPETLYGPTRRIASTLAPGTAVPVHALLAAAAEAAAFIDVHHRLPDSIWVGSQQLSPADFLVTAADLLAAQVRAAGASPTGPAPHGGSDLLQIRPGNMVMERHISDSTWGWVVFPEEFSAPGITELARLQAWTLKPALFS